MNILVIGGSGSGKSEYAERILCGLCPEEKVYLATMEAFGEEGMRRVARHRALRAGKGFSTVERPRDIAGAGIVPGSAVLLECLPNLLAGEMFGGGDTERIFPGLQKLAGESRHLVIVTQDVFRDAEQYDAGTKRYREMLCRLNAQAAQLCDAVAEVVCGIPIMLKGRIEE